MGPSLELVIGRVPGCTTASVRGDLDLATADDLQARLGRLVAETPPVLVVDLRGVAFIDATGLGVVVSAARDLSRSGGRLVLRHPSTMLRRMLVLLDLERELPVAEDP